MSFLGHLEALRGHLFRSSMALLVGAIAAFAYPHWVFDRVLLFPLNPDFPTYQAICALMQSFGMGSTFCLEAMPFELLNTQLSGQFNMHLWVSFCAGLVLSFPYIAWEIWRFVGPGLHASEKKAARGMVGFVSLLFGLGIGFGYFLLVPFSVQFFGGYKVSAAVVNYIDLTSFVGSLTAMTLACGLLFQLPVAIYFLSRAGMVGPEWLKRYRKHALVLILVAAAVITPPDLFSQIVLSIPLFLLYELSIFISASQTSKSEVSAR
ncbi:twin-arginine translocase subunit TatC [bacterium]|nr:twin-arginine translocase subunit TatC [bacterium]